MSAKLQHNHFLGLKAIAKKLQDELENMKNFYDIDDLKNIKVKLVKEALSKELPKLINVLKNNNDSGSIFPKILIAKGLSVRTDTMGNAYGMKNEITLEEIGNQDNKIFLSGHYQVIETDIQFIILTRTQIASHELQMELKRILNTTLDKVYYALQIIKGEENILYRVDDYGFLTLHGFGNVPFETQYDEETSLYATYITGVCREQYFKYEEANYIKRKEIISHFKEDNS